MKACVDAFSQLAVDAFNKDQLVNTGLRKPRTTAEMPEQRRAALCTHADDFFQRAGLASLLATASMASDRKTMRLVTYRLD